MLEGLNEFFFTIFIFLFILFLYLHIQFQLKTSDDLEIYEIENELTKEKMEEICDLRQPIVLDTTEELSQLIPIFSKTALIKDFSFYEVKVRNKKNIRMKEDLFTPLQINIANKLFLKDASKNYYSENNSDFLNESGLIKIIRVNDFILKPYFSCSSSYDVLFGTTNVETPLRHEHNYRNYIMVTEGKVIVRLIPPKYNKYCDVERSRNIPSNRPGGGGKIKQRYHKIIMKKIKYLDVELSVGKILYLPAYWLYSIKICENSSLLLMKYCTYMNMMTISPTLVMNWLQNQNIKTNYLKKMELETIAEEEEKNEDKDVAEEKNIEEKNNEEM